MAESSKILDQITNLWGKAGSRLRMAVGATVLVGILAAVLMSVTEKPKGVLFAGLEPSDAAQVVAALDAAKIEYDLDGGGTIVRVPTADIDRVRLLLAEQDLPKGGKVGFELFEEQKFGLTDFAQRVNFRRALQGELERTISALDPVASARIHITMPDRKFFDDANKPTASVTVDLHPGRTLSERQVGAVRHLVAAAVEGLEAGDVTIVDTKGGLLSRAGGTDAAAGAALDYERDLERDLEQRVTRLLERTVGVGGAQVTVSADIDFSRTDTTEEVYDPEQSAVRSEAIEEVREGAGAKRPQGLAGAPANQPGANTAGTAESDRGATRMVTSKNYEVNRTVVQTKGPASAIRRLTVAAMVDGTYTTPTDGGEAVFNPRSKQELDELQGLVESAAGVNTARGDRVKIVSVQFRDRPPTGAESIAPPDRLPAWLPWAIGGGVATLLGLTWIMLNRRPGREVTAEVLSFPTTVEEAQRAIAQVEQRGLPGAQPAQAALAAAAPTREAIIHRAGAEPERTADIIRSWMSDGSEDQA